MHANEVLCVYTYKETHKWIRDPLTQSPQDRPRQKPGERYYTVQQVVNLVNLVIDQAYIQVGGKVFKQVQGIPMGVNPACFFANYYLFMYEYMFMQRLIHQISHSVNPTALQVMQAFRYCGKAIEDLQTISWQPIEFVQQFLYTNQQVNGVVGIYPPDSIRLKLCNEHSSRQANFTDITIRPS